MNILIIAHFTRDFSATDNGRFSYLAKQLAKEHNVEIVTTSWSRGLRSKKKPVTLQYPFKITFLDEPGYQKTVSLKRFYSHRIWGKNLKKYLESIPKPDVIYCAIPSLTGPGYVADYCEKNNIRFIIDVQDLWPEAFKMVFNVPIISDLVFNPFNKLANKAYSKADGICAVSMTYVDRALSVNRKVKSGNTVFLGTNLSTFDEYASQPAKLKKQDNEVWLAYCGTLGSSYDLTCVFDALEIIAHKGIPYRFIIMGSGPKREEFEHYAKAKKLDTVFTGRLEYSEMCAQLCECDICVNPIMHNAAQSITNKHGDYASSGLPVVSTQENEEYRNLVEEYHMGFNCHNNDAADLAEKIERLILDENLRKEMGANARRCAEEKFDRKNSYKALISEIL
ncbi:MAG: glycosyltransferase family 4 protein, partial [Clostridiaceae bacterium]|nr:glycosyltransferase family 4 protein [Clostridiaceae bacterium]